MKCLGYLTNPAGLRCRQGHGGALANRHSDRLRADVSDSRMERAWQRVPTYNPCHVPIGALTAEPLHCITRFIIPAVMPAVCSTSIISSLVW